MMVTLGYVSLKIITAQTEEMVMTVKQLLIEQQNNQCKSIAINLGHALYRYKDGRSKAGQVKACKSLEKDTSNPWAICQDGNQSYIHLTNNSNEIIHIDIVDFYNHHLNKLIKGLEGSMWVMTPNGEVLIDNNKELLGKNIFEVFKSESYKEFRKVKTDLEQKKQGIQIYKYDWKNSQGEIRMRILSYYHHNLMGRDVVTCCSFDTEAISNHLIKQSENSKQQALILFLAFCVFLFFAIFLQLRRNKINSEKKNLSRFLSPKIVSEVLKNNLDLEAQISLRNVSIIMIDLRNFTKISNDNSITLVIRFLSEFYSMCNKEIFDSEGTVDKYLGDSVMAVFGAPNDMDNFHEIAVECSKQIIHRFETFKEKWEKEISTEELGIGISIASGEVITGPIGSADKFDYTVIGSPVNLAARLEGLNKRFKTKLCICDNTWDHLRNRQDFSEPENIELRGFENKKTVYFLKTP